MEKFKQDVESFDSSWLKDLPPVPDLDFEDIKTYSVRNNEDIARLNKEAQLQDSWLGSPDDDLKPVEALLLMGLTSAIKKNCADKKPKVRFQSFGIESLDKHIRAALYRCTSELVNYAQAHAGAEHIFVQLMTEDGLVSITVHDDGKGFNPEKDVMDPGMGKVFATVFALNGQVHIYTSEGQGTEICIEIEQLSVTDKKYDIPTYS